MTVITVSRQYGSGGDEIVEEVCQQLGCRYFDRRAIARAAMEVGLTETEVMEFSEETRQAQNFFDRLFRRTKPVAHARVWRETTTGVRVADSEAIDEGQIVSLVEAAVRAAYREGNIIVVGRGGQAILMDKPGVLHVRIEAPFAMRVQRTSVKEGLDWQPSEALVQKRDAAAADYIRKYYDVDWSDPSLYHLIVNTGKWNLHAAADLLIQAIRLFDRAHQPVEAG
ncbi:MAG TPA: cytidylate kinase-like family protein [Anaerolineaceae bacterium]|nr:cytidylate kinase-like family protein [Anaerolineaceae bacterium]